MNTYNYDEPKEEKIRGYCSWCKSEIKLNDKYIIDSGHLLHKDCYNDLNTETDDLFGTCSNEEFYFNEEEE